MKEIYDIIREHTGKRDIEFELTDKPSDIKGLHIYYIKFKGISTLNESIDLMNKATKEAEKTFPVKDCYIMYDSGNYVLAIETTSLHKRVTRKSMKVLLGL